MCNMWRKISFKLGVVFMNKKISYKAPTLYGIDASKVSSMAANRYQTSQYCCTCTGHGMSRA